MAAEGLAADTQTAQHTGLVTHADLAQLDTGTENAGQILHQGAEVHAALGGEEKDDLAGVKAELHLHQLHVQLVALHQLLADPHGLFFTAAVLIDLLLVLRSGQTHHRAQGLHHHFVLNKAVGADTGAVFQTLSGLHDDALTGGHPQPVGVKIILLSARFEADADDLSHGWVFLQSTSIQRNNSAANQPRV